MKKRACILLGILIAGCGGGGGGGSASAPVPPPVYSGSTSAATLDNTVSAGQFAYAVVGSSGAEVVGGPILSPVRTAISASASTRSLVVQALRRVVPHPRAAGNRVLAAYQETVQGAEGGTVTVSINTGLWSNGTEYVTSMGVAFSAFDDTMDGIVNPIDGIMSILPDTWSVEGFPVYYQSSFDLHVTAAPGSGARMIGSLGFHQVAPSDMRHRYTWENVLFIDDATGIEILWNPLTEIDEDTDPSHDLISTTGTVYISYSGYAEISTLTFMDYPPGGLTPVSGSLLLRGGNGKTATVTVAAIAPEVRVDLDVNGDGTTDVTAMHAWGELAIF